MPEKGTEIEKLYRKKSINKLTVCMSKYKYKVSMLDLLLISSPNITILISTMQFII